ncbi:transaldolase [bacterium]|nr:transaldolase [bacterium]
MSKLHELLEFGQSVWLDFIERNLIESGELKDYVELGVCGVTSNPSIFKTAIANGTAYDSKINELVTGGHDAEEIFEALALEDIANAADILRPIYDETDGRDGFVSLEVDPRLANDSVTTITEARRLFSVLARPNIMIKVPATRAGYTAIEQLISEGINTNATLIFSIEQYTKVAQAYIFGIDRLIERGGNPSKVASVASFFVSRLDGKMDPLLEKAGALELQGRIAVSYSKTVYAKYKNLFSSAKWQELSTSGARPQRLLWASTGTKNPKFSDVLYVENLIGSGTVNTIPPKTLVAVLDHLEVGEHVNEGLDEAGQILEKLPGLGVNIEQVNNELLAEGVDKFTLAFTELIESIGNKAKE